MLKKTCHDLELIHCFRQGSKNAAEDLHNRYYCKILGVCKAYLKSHQDAEDTTQSILIELLVKRKITMFKGTSQLWTWIYRVTVNACHAYARSAKRTSQNVIDSPWVWNNLPDPDKNPEEQNSLREEKECLVEALQHLNTIYRAPLILVGLRGRTYAQAAHELQISTSTLGVRLIRAKKQLSRYWERNV